MKFIVCFAALLFLVVGCSKIPNGPETAAGKCDELGGGSYGPITLGKILCIAKDSTGTVFLVDQTDSIGSIIRCFISKSNAFHRVEVRGSSVMNQTDYSLSLGDSVYLRLKFTNYNGAWSGALCSGQTPNQTCETLTTLERSELPDYPIMNFPPSIFIEYLARDSLGNYLLITRPKYGWDGSPTTMAVHYGTPRAMIKEPVMAIAVSTISTRIIFTLNGENATAVFDVVFSNGMFSPGPAYLQVNGVKRTLEIIQPDEQIMQMLGFDCWAEMNH